MNSWKGRGLALPFGILLIYWIFGYLYEPDFISVQNINTILYSSSVLLPACLGMQVLIILGKFDLSVGAVASLSGMVSGFILASGENLFVAIISGVFVATVTGLLNGFLVAYLSIDSLIATLAMTGIARSISLAVNDGQVVTGFADTIFDLNSWSIAGLSVFVVVSGAIIVISEFIFRHAVFFRRFYATGGNPLATTLSGVRVPLMLTAGYCLASIGASITGILQISRTMSASPTIFNDLALDTLAACIIGGSSLTGGKGTMLGAALGLIVVGATRNLVTLAEIAVYWKEFAVGMLILLAIFVDLLQSRLRLAWRNNLISKHQEKALTTSDH